MEMKLEEIKAELIRGGAVEKGRYLRLQTPSGELKIRPVVYPRGRFALFCEFAEPSRVNLCMNTPALGTWHHYHLRTAADIQQVLAKALAE
jgi:hypothetical protein